MGIIKLTIVVPLMKRKINNPEIQSAPTEQRLLMLWNRFGSNTAGRWLFNRLLSRAVPYSGSIHPEIQKLTPGFVEVCIKDRRKVRNHLHCIHAIALANLGELASGLAMLSALPHSTKAIVTHIEMEYLKKARGKLTAIGLADPPENLTTSIDVLVHAEIKNQEGIIVAVAHVLWRLAPREPR
ncbi:MAG TPA: DUF4442 domain-containing protein [Leucothrix mucor]|nr:DUF4442 domain-containing protein [Leucothrix mucor]